jgi:hypothetical protein
MSLATIAQELATKGRHGDSTLVHMTPAEVAGLAAIARAHGGDITINPDTGLPEANFLKKILPALAGAAVGSITGMNPFMSSLLVGGATGLASGSLSKGLAAGLGAYSGASLAGGLSTLGEQAMASQALRGASDEVFAEGLSPQQIAGTANASPFDKLSAGFNRLTEKGGPQAFVNAMGGNKALMQAGLAGLAGASMMAPQRTVPTVTQQPSLIRPMVMQREQRPWYEAHRTGQHFNESLTPMTPYQAAEGGEVPSTDAEPVQMYADGGQTLDMNRLRGMQQTDAINYLRGIAPGQLNITSAQNPSEGGGMFYTAPGGLPGGGDMLRPIYTGGSGEGEAQTLTGFTRPLTPEFDPTYAGGRFGQYFGNYDPQGQLRDITFNPQERHGGFLNENQDLIANLAIGALAGPGLASLFNGGLGGALASGAILGGGSGAMNALTNDQNILRGALRGAATGAAGSGLSYGVGQLTNNANLGGADSVGDGGAGGPSVESAIDEAFPRGDYDAYTRAALDAANTGATGSSLTDLARRAGTSVADFVRNNSTLTALGVAGLAGAAADTPDQRQTTGTGTTIPTNTNPIITSTGGTTNTTQAGGNRPGMRTQSEIAFDYLMGRRPTSRATEADLSTQGLIDLYNQRGNMSEADFVRLMQQRGVTNDQLLLARNTALDRRNATLAQPTVNSLTDAYRQQVAAGGSERNIVDNMRNQGVSVASMNDARNAMLGLPASTSWDEANRLYAERQAAEQQAAAIAAARQASERQGAEQQAAQRAATYTPESIADAYRQSVGTGAATEEQFVDYAKSLGITKDQLMAARGMLASGGIASLARGGMPRDGHLGDYSDGGRLLRGPGDGVSDSIPASINGRRPARLADGEFVFPARIVSELGNGSTEAGARRLYAMMDRIQKRRRKTVGRNAVAVDSKAHKLLPA